MIPVLMATTLLAGRAVTPSCAPLDTLERITITTGSLRFDALAVGPDSGELVILLHGFPETGYTWRDQLAAIGKAGYRAVAPDQRGYSAGARPRGVEPYRVQHLVADVLAMATELGARRFHLVGHDWGGAVAWITAATAGDRILTLTVLSTPHYAALAATRLDSASDQGQRSSYLSTYAAEGAEARFLEDGMSRLQQIYVRHAPEARKLYLEALGHPEALRAALAWYRASFGPQAATASAAASGTIPSITVPTLYLWGAADPSFSRAAAEATRHYIHGPYRFVPIEGAGHWLTEEHPDVVTTELLNHLRLNAP